jgi:hypothetical protein
MKNDRNMKLSDWTSQAPARLAGRPPEIGVVGGVGRQRDGAHSGDTRGVEEAMGNRKHQDPLTENGILTARVDQRSL